MSKEIKNTIIIIATAIVIVLSILGFASYLKDNSINLHFGIGNVGIGKGDPDNGEPGKIDFDFGDGSSGGGSGGGSYKTKKGNFIRCESKRENNDESRTEVVILELKNNKVVSDLAQIEYIYKLSNENRKKYSDDEIKSSMIKYVCANDSKRALCGNAKVSISGNTFKMTALYDMSYGNRSFVGMTAEEAEKQLISTASNATCKKITKSPIYGTKLDPTGTYYNRYSDSEKTYNDNNSGNGNSGNNGNNGNNDNNGGGTVARPAGYCTGGQVSFEISDFSYKNNVSTLTVKADNFSDTACQLKSMDVLIYDDNGKNVASVRMYVGTLNAKSVSYIKGTTSVDLRNIDFKKFNSHKYQLNTR